MCLYAPFINLPKLYMYDIHICDLSQIINTFFIGAFVNKWDEHFLEKYNIKIESKN